MSIFVTRSQVAAMNDEIKLKIEEYIKRFYKDQGLSEINPDGEGLQFVSGQNKQTNIIIDKEEIEEFAALWDKLKSFRPAPVETSIIGPGYREQLIDHAAASRGSLFLLRNQNYRFSTGDDEVLVEIGPPTPIFINFFRFRKDKAQFFHDRVSKIGYMNRPTSLREVFSRFSTIRYSVGNDDLPEIEETSRLFESCLFELSYLKNRHFEIRNEWPTVRQRKWNFSPRRVASGNSFKLKRIHYEFPVLKFYQRGMSTDDAYIQFISFYHVLEYYFVSVTDEILYSRLSRIINDPAFKTSPKQLDKIIMSMEDHKRSNDETEMLKNVLKKFTDEKDIVEFLNEYQKSENQMIYSQKNECFGQELEKMNISEGHIFGPLAKRIKIIRNSLIHSSDRYERKERYLPGVEADRVLRREIPLLRFLAERVVIATSIIEGDR